MTLTAVAIGDRVGAEAQRVTELIAAVVAGDRVAAYRLMAVVRPAVLRYCRARLGSGDPATQVARRVCRTVGASLSELPSSALDVHAFVHRIAVELVDDIPAHDGLPGMAGMLGVLSSAQREVLVLRVAVGLSAEETAAALGSTPEAVRHTQHHALDRLRSAA